MINENNEESLDKTNTICPHCQKSIEFSKNFFKQTMTCPNCGNDVSLLKTDTIDQGEDRKKPLSILFNLLGCGVMFIILSIIAAFSRQLFLRPSFIYVVGIVVLVGMLVAFMKKKFK